MFAVVNTFRAIKGETIGTIESRHLTIEAAESGQRACQPRGLGMERSYIPTRIVKLTDSSLRKGDYVRTGDWVDPE
jgi:hypothetical protein